MRRSARQPPPPLDSAGETLRDELRRDVEMLAGRIGERHVPLRYEAFCATADWIEGELAQAGYEPSRQEYTSRGHAVWNIEGERPGGRLANEILVIGAHYDTVIGSPGANDNGSAVASGLALARRLAGETGDRTVRFVFFANEELPFFMTREWGSWQYAARCRERRERLAGMLCLECMGSYSDAPGSQNYPPGLKYFYPDAANFIAFVGNFRSRDFVCRVVGAFRRHATIACQSIAIPAVLPDLHRSDHAAFWQHGYPAIMITDTANFRYAHYHTPQDTPDKLNYESLARVVAGLEKAVRFVAGMPMGE